ncbi:hypothetical protein C5F64_00520 [Photobacterium damselae subsp. damselae]|uniref:hypothetical protein n=1 Tax=Photobacterium damselae TaxID=38293 RepID=UPI000D06FB54|nr:hypothetical protein [Photobacterium damselae]PSB91424.1 hypothetical protein C5F64_00520 [Photobacterium damselae subsp. damselae]
MLNPEDARDIIAKHLRQCLLECGARTPKEAELILCLAIKESARSLNIAVGQARAKEAIEIALQASEKAFTKDDPFTVRNIQRLGFDLSQILDAPESIN